MGLISFPETSFVSLSMTSPHFQNWLRLVYWPRQCLPRVGQTEQDQEKSCEVGSGMHAVANSPYL